MIEIETQLSRKILSIVLSNTIKSNRLLYKLERRLKNQLLPDFGEICLDLKYNLHDVLLKEEKGE
jgi:hypothetical protein